MNQQPNVERNIQRYFTTYIVGIIIGMKCSAQGLRGTQGDLILILPLMIHAFARFRNDINHAIGIGAGMLTGFFIYNVGVFMTGPSGLNFPNPLPDPHARKP